MEEKIIKKVFDEAEEKINLLKRQRQNSEMSIVTFLTLASQIRDSISINDDVKSFCTNNIDYSQRRKKLLDEIHDIQKMVIDEYTKSVDMYESEKYGLVIDFNEAKKDIVTMIEEEQSLNLFEETADPQIFKLISECKTHEQTLSRVAKNCKHGKYKVLIMGDFQSGKSTTLDAFCDGRHISAIGKGTATSAVLVSVTYAEKESMLIKWRAKEDFQPVFDRIKQYLQDFNWNSFDLAKSDCREQLITAINDFRKSKNCPNIGEGDAKFLMLSDFVLKYFDSEELDLKKSSLQNVSEISEITKFPENGESMWMKSGMEDFSINDVIFIFISSVECFIPSTTLKELNCTIIDSPGLFNSTYDTMVTVKAMKDAHAIMYVLPYHKGIGMDVCKSLFTIKENYVDFHRKLFIVNNLKLTDDNLFYESNCRQIENMFGSDKQVYQYDAKLSYLAQLRKLYDNELAVKKDYSHLMCITEKGFGKKKKEHVFEQFDEAWAYHMKIYSINDYSPKSILEESGFKDLTAALKEFIGENESYAVIVSNGLMPMTNEIITIKNRVYRSFIEPYSSSHDALVNLWQERINKSIEFQKFVTKVAKDHFFVEKGVPSLLDRMSAEEYSKLFTYDLYKRLAEEISAILYDNKGSLLATKTLLTNKDKFKKRFAELSFPWIKDKILELVNAKILDMQDNIEREQDVTITNMFTPVATNLENALKEEWKSSFEDDKDFCITDYLLVPLSLSVNANGENKQKTYKTGDLSGNGVDATLLGGIIAQISLLVAGIATMIAGYITMIVTDVTGTTLLVALGLGIGGTIITSFAPDMVRNKFIESLSQKIEPKISVEAVSGFKSIVKEQLKQNLTAYVDKLKVDINKMRNDRDIALAPTPDMEHCCFVAVDKIQQINSQLKKYEDFKEKHLKTSKG